ncbi:hypothetical protein Hdeb2414_s0006g00207961 [Helianthus debilis subsp. tardiflorus]
MRRCEQPQRVVANLLLERKKREGGSFRLRERKSEFIYFLFLSLIQNSPCIKLICKIVIENMK